MKPESAYTPWPAEPVAAWLDWPDDIAPVGRLWYRDPDGGRAMTHVEHGISLEGRSDPKYGNVWSIVEHDDGTVTVSPSIHAIGYFHTPKPVRFRLVSHAELWEA